MTQFYLNKQAERLWDIPQKGEAVQLVEVGTHCRGAIFLDGVWVKTEMLEQAIDGISQTYPGFYFGRFDIQTRSVEDFKQGRNFKIVELNGVTSEATHIYDPKNSLFAATKFYLPNGESPLRSERRTASAISNQVRCGLWPASCLNSDGARGSNRPNVVETACTPIWAKARRKKSWLSSTSTEFAFRTLHPTVGFGGTVAETHHCRTKSTTDRLPDD